MPSRADISILQIDAFAAEPFTGNPAAVCLPATEPPTGWMQQVASEMNLSETAFAWPSGDGHRLRWFTPVAEVDLCGHATLATAHALWESGRLAKGEQAVFETQSGKLTASQAGDAIQLDFPAEPAEACVDDVLEQAIGTEVIWCGKNRMDFMVQLPSANAVRRCRPDLPRLAKLETRGIIITAEADDDRTDFISRFFCPTLGINEDPVTGSAHCCLTPFWAERLGRNTLVGFQASKRGGFVRCTLTGDRVLLGGQAVTIFSGTMNTPPPGA
ncbi:MAG: PhzF family phenazine biosynthesis protein [Verrucomicrobiota bacterium]|jgi:PhzF family phenazine biosynthesis protein|nr:PhzF family phenazine biosynthesis protein [Verrucomicrobiota bacterium]MDP7048431.1 PhzF family phenazine biosynthesis protein [Verrucomicrobiota bacterium]